MLSEVTRPYLIIPLLVQQSTWGGSYITTYKNLTDNELRSWKIGQSYELYGKSILSLTSDTSDRHFVDDVVWYNKNGNVSPTSEVLLLKDLIKKDCRAVLGPAVKGEKMPLLLKFTQALGNSFQLHVKKGAETPRWQPKPESWFYLEDGILTFGIKKNADLDEYKKVCLEVESKMKSLSKQLQNRILDYKKAAEAASAFIKEKNPWRFVNVHRVKKHAAIDLSPGGLHHSWEEDPVHCPLGNILFEIQLDVSDEASTIRCFDKGKMKKNGDIRPIHVEDYFANLDTNPNHNDLSLATRKRTGANLLTTPYYSLDLMNIHKEGEYETGASFVHLFVVEGEVMVESASYTVTVEKGYSCIIPYATKVYSLTPTKPGTTVLKSYIV